MLILHIIIALASIVAASNLAIAPKQTKIKLNYVLVAGTLTSGSYLIVFGGAHLLAACASGLAYISVVAIMITIGSRRLATVEAR